MPESNEAILRPLDFLQTGSKRRAGIEHTTGLIVLNCPIADSQLLQRVWSNASYRLCADGGANRVYDLYAGEQNKSSREAFLPSEIYGDLDSLRDDVRQYYTSHAVPVNQHVDDYSTDFDKSVARLIEAIPSLSDIILLGSLSGRVDHGIGMLAEIYRFQKQHPGINFWLFSESSISFILNKGKAIVATPVAEGLITENAGILPIFGPAHITLQGFEWDVTDWPTELGGQISTSNHIKAEQVSVETDCDVLFTIERVTA
ncbi:thiamine pyrophosphokinase-like protein [Elsinoe fawcettii]|nr:thiamine pyrophosphokinase-like protein [Elsinoe fawcettii]